MASANSEKKLARFNHVINGLDRADTDELSKVLLGYLHSDHSDSSNNNRILSKIAVIAEENQLYTLVPDLKEAYQRMLADAVNKDANCTAKSAIMRCLVTLDCDDVDFWLAGLRYQQLEPTWGGTVDTAIDVRCSSAMGLVSTTYSRSMIELLHLLNDKEANARAGAIRAMRYGIPYEAALVLRQKIAQGDDEVEIIGECFIALLQVEPRQSLSLVSAYLHQDDEALYEMAALALGESHLDDAFNAIQQAWDDTFSIHQRQREVLIRATVQHRSDDAFDWLLSLLLYADETLSLMIIEPLSIYKSNQKLRKRVKEVLDENGDEIPLKSFYASW